MSSAIEKRKIQRVSLSPADDQSDSEHDEVVVEAPLELWAHGRPFVTSMRTPGHDLELIRGLLFGEGVIEAADTLADLHAEEPATGEGGRRVYQLAREISPELRRTLVSSASCGVCGSATIRGFDEMADPVHRELDIRPVEIVRMVQAINDTQEVFGRTGGSHAAAIYDSAGVLLVQREDVGRHNAVDKTVGNLLARGNLGRGAVLVVSGRVSFEIMQKAVRAQVGLVAAVSAPTSLAIDLAEQFQVTLCGFVRSGRLNVYAHGWRVADGDSQKNR